MINPFLEEDIILSVEARTDYKFKSKYMSYKPDYQRVLEFKNRFKAPMKTIEINIILFKGIFWNLIEICNLFISAFLIVIQLVILKIIKKIISSVFCVFTILV